MNSLLWIAQIVLAGVFLFAGFSKIFVNGRQTRVLQTASGPGCVGMPDELAAAVALLEILGALCVVVPIDLWPPDILPRMAAAVLGLVAIVTAIFQARRQEHTTPTIVAFLLALFVIIGRWQR